MSRLLTKSKFKTGCECPTKLFFGSHKEYVNKKLDDSFLQALAKGGFQIGALAQMYHENGIPIESLDHAEALRDTAELMKREEVVIFEAAFQYGDLFIRVDILKKHGQQIDLIEVKAKSIDYDSHETFYDKRKLKAKKPQKVVVGKWRPYLLDVAFQAYVLSKLFPNFQINSFLTLANKAKQATIEGLNQLFLIGRDESGRTKIHKKIGITRKALGEEILVQVPVDDEVKTLWESEIHDGVSFEPFLNFLKNNLVNDQKPNIDINSKCKKCEFRVDNLEPGQKSGFNECWGPIYKASGSTLDRPLSIDIWYFASEKALEEGKYFADQLEESDFTTESRRERQWLQVIKSKSKDLTPDLKATELAGEIKKWVYPLHFIDFETTMVAIPFNKGRHPYEQIAFQFSHHIVHKDGQVEHKTQYLNMEKGKFPNFDFVRALKAALSEDNGTIFRFHNHENTVLRQIRNQLLESKEPDRNELVQWIQTIATPSKDKDAEQWESRRPMVDLYDLVIRYYYHPLTDGSNSIKDVLPAVLQASSYLQAKYSKPIYGSKNGIKSSNFENQIWIHSDDGEIANPYKSLPELFQGIEFEAIDLITDEDDASLRDGGAAMTAYARMQFTEMSEIERNELAQALLKYCELDTLAMVMIFEYWRDELQRMGKLAA